MKRSLTTFLAHLAAPLKCGLVFVCACLPLQPSIASRTTQATPLIDLSTVDVSPHELALTQVLSEICPRLLGMDKQKDFMQSYETHLKLLIPNADSKAVMAQFNRQKEYRTILEGIRRWTLSYPAVENKALCLEIAEASFDH